MISLSHKNLIVYNKSIELVSEIYNLTTNFPRYELYGLISQLRRSAISVTSNIAEGASRTTKPDKRRFFIIARSSLVELDSQIEISIKLQYLDKNKIRNLEVLANEVFAMLSRIIR